MKRVSFMIKCLALLLILSCAATGRARAETAAETVVQNLYNQLEASMKQAEQLGFSGRYKKLDPTIRASFNIPLMTRMAVGSVWSSAQEAQQQQLINAFSDFTIASYASQFAAWHGESFAVLDEKPAIDGVIVETRLTTKDGAPIPLNYLMRQDNDGHYRIVDIYLNGAISQLATRRAEFSSIAQRDGIEALVTSLGEKSKQLGPS